MQHTVYQTRNWIWRGSWGCSYLGPCHIWRCASIPWLRRSPVGDRARWRWLSRSRRHRWCPTLPCGKVQPDPRCVSAGIQPVWPLADRSAAWGTGTGMAWVPMWVSAWLCSTVSSGPRSKSTRARTEGRMQTAACLLTSPWCQLHVKKKKKREIWDQKGRRFHLHINNISLELGDPSGWTVLAVILHTVVVFLKSLKCQDETPQDTCQNICSVIGSSVYETRRPAERSWKYTLHMETRLMKESRVAPAVWFKPSAHCWLDCEVKKKNNGELLNMSGRQLHERLAALSHFVHLFLRIFCPVSFNDDVALKISFPPSLGKLKSL